MPLFKKPDFWFPNNRYYANDRQKSVVMFNNQLYVCNTTHISGSTFDTNYFTSISGSGGGLVATDWDIVGTTTTLYPIQVMLNDTIDSTFSQYGNVDIITANNPLTEYTFQSANLFGGFKSNIDRLDNEVKTINISSFNGTDNDFISFVLTGLSKADLIAAAMSNTPPTNSLVVTLANIGGISISTIINDTNGTTINSNTATPSIPGANEIRIYINKDRIELVVNNVTLYTINENEWQDNIIGQMNMCIYSLNYPGLIERTNILYDMPSPFTVTPESLVVVDVPNGATDGSLYKLTSEGTYNGYPLLINDYVIFQEQLQSLLVIPYYIYDIPVLQLDSFKNKVYERGIIDEIYTIMPVNQPFPQFYTFLYLPTSAIYAVTINNEYILIDPLDNTFRIKDSGLLLVRNNTGTLEPNSNINIISEVYNDLSNSIIDNTFSYQLLEENAHNKRIGQTNVVNTGYYDIYLSDDIGNKIFVFDADSATITVNIHPDNYNVIQSPSYRHTKEMIVYFNNIDTVEKEITFSGVTCVNSNTIKLCPNSQIYLKLTTNYNQNSFSGEFLTAELGLTENINTTFYATANSNIYYYVKDIIIDSSDDINVDILFSHYHNHTYNIYNYGPAVTVVFKTNNLVEHTVVLATGDSRKLFVVGTISNQYNIESRVYN